MFGFCFMIKNAWLTFMLAWDCTGCGLVLFSWLVCTNSGETWYSRPSEQVSLKREYHKTSLVLTHIVAQAMSRENLTVPLLSPLSPEQENLSRLSECFQPERELCRDVLKCCFLLCLWLMVTWLIELPYLKHEVCEYACIKWFLGWNW